MARAPVNPATKAYYILRYLGARVVWLRAKVYLNQYLGTSRRVFRSRPWESLDLASLTRPGTPTTAAEYAAFKRAAPPAFLFAPGEPPEVPAGIRAGAERQPGLAERMRLLAEDRCVYFLRTPSPAAIDWNYNPIDDKRAPSGKVWCDIPEYLPEQGDLRMMWEPARAAWAIDCARAPTHGLDQDAAALYWRWVESWMRACPPFEGFQWRCGQESAVRFIALALGFWSLADDPATTPARCVSFARIAWATGYRIAHHINYAISQKNNHALSEACGLMLIAQLFPELRDAPGWWRKGAGVLAREIRRQTYADGSYLQQSMNYHRVMLAVSMLGLRIAELRGEPFERDVYDRLGLCGEFLFQMMEPSSGRLPQYGPNDGAHVLPLNECDFHDFRPVIQATHYLTTRRRRLPAGAWDEDLLWLFGAEALAAPATPATPPESRAFDVGGYYTLRGENSWAMLRCHTYRDRTVQCDALNLDLWYRGRNVVRDCGSYKYYVPGRPDLEMYFKSSAAHNVIEIDGRPPLELMSRFLWFPWTRARTRHFEATPDRPLYFEGEHYDYERRPWRIRCRRTVIGLPDDAWVVVDDVLGSGEREVTLRWHLIDVPYEFDEQATVLRLRLPEGTFTLAAAAFRPAGAGGSAISPDRAEVIRGRDGLGRVQGIASDSHGEYLPVPTLELAYGTSLPLRIVTAFGPQATSPRFAAESDGRQRWTIDAGRAAWDLELAVPACGVRRNLLRCTPATISATV